jgi:hypothetical protein
LRTAEACYARVVAAFARRPGVSEPAGEAGGPNRFGANALKLRGKIFAMLVRGEFVAKIPRARVDELVAAGRGRRFEPGTGRVMREWFVAAGVSEAAWKALAEEAFVFAGGLSALRRG